MVTPYGVKKYVLHIMSKTDENDPILLKIFIYF